VLFESELLKRRGAKLSKSVNQQRTARRRTGRGRRAILSDKEVVIQGYRDIQNLKERESKRQREGDEASI
jgi:hypothetical protein